ncbi:MAG: hypothetical protein IPK86_00005 [Neisseriales bacterium]|nr:MAG: hypothetical protein IPK86_00005 [Neisseriales bacterium]
MHHDLMKEQKRAAKSKDNGEKAFIKEMANYRKSCKAGRAEETSGHKKSTIDHKNKI